MGAFNGESDCSKESVKKFLFIPAGFSYSAVAVYEKRIRAGTAGAEKFII